jgi:arylsulfatase A-like enzyme
MECNNKLQKPNILFITIDALRTDRLGCYGYKGDLTPNIDKLANEGITFTQTITGGSWTQAAFPVLLTSSYASMYGGCLGYLAPERPSPVEALAKFGYTTAGFSTNPHISKATGYDRGFDEFIDFTPDEDDPRLRKMRGGQTLLSAPMVHSLFGLFGLKIRPARLYSPAEEVTETVCKWIKNVQTPFFTWVHYMDVHWPYHIEEELRDSLEIAQAWQDLALMSQRSLDGRQFIDAQQGERFANLYHHSLQYMDNHIGRLLRCVNSLGYERDTVIIIAADHGEEFLDHGRWGHWESNLYDEIIRVPMIIRFPDSNQSRQISNLVRTIDIMPTILDLCTNEVPEDVVGQSLLPLFGQNSDGYKITEAISEMHRAPWHRIAVRMEDYKYIWDSKEPDKPELYDLVVDPGEQVNIFMDQADVVNKAQECVNAHLHLVEGTQTNGIVREVDFDEDIEKRLRDLGYLD